ncbi:MAG: 3-deoxy-7-phosphoheptulonate synthase class II [SAR324 cluster bacterium]|nr:3-deoxy-7-phosphoheptulonate synthase class II [SAR324 cluster bacterium]
MNANNWNKKSWEAYPALQQGLWPDLNEHKAAIEQLESLPPLVFAGEIRSLKAEIAKAQEGKAFLLQGGDCAEEFKSCTAPVIRETLRVLLQMAVVMSFAGEKPVIKLGRIAGQYAKPRSSPTEMVGDLELMSYRGDIVNSPEATVGARTPDAKKLIEGYWHSAATLNILRAYTKGGFADLHRVHSWNQEFIKNSQQGHRYDKLAQDIDKALKFLKVIGIPEDSSSIHQAQVYTSHEALLLDYETALTREDSTQGGWYDCSGHMLWIGDRTRQLDGAHVEFMRGILNPIGMKIGPKHDIDEVKSIINRLNPDNEAGKITLITRFGATGVQDKLPKLLREIKKEGMKVLWSCDPMHGNTFLSDSKYKTRNFESILEEIKQFFAAHKAEGTVAGGVHLELTGLDVTECVGGAQQIEDHHLKKNYATSCDPRLNAQQSLELAFLISDMIKN